jgi:hypothetical protein
VDMSGHGLYLITDRMVECGAPFSIILTFPGEKSSPPVIMPTRTRVVRCEPIWHRGMQRIGVAAEIEHFRV